jgi:inhibitor of cysteine peptidase
MATHDLGPEHDGRRLTVHGGDAVRLRLPENPTTGYRWQWLDLDPRLAATLEDEFQPPAAAAPGAGGVRIFRLRAVTAGSHRLALRCVRMWQAEGDPAATFEVVLDVIADLRTPGDPS